MVSAAVQGIAHVRLPVDQEHREPALGEQAGALEAGEAGAGTGCQPCPGLLPQVPGEDG